MYKVPALGGKSKRIEPENIRYSKQIPKLIEKFNRIFFEIMPRTKLAGTLSVWSLLTKYIIDNVTYVFQSVPKVKRCTIK